MNKKSICSFMAGVVVTAAVAGGIYLYQNPGGAASTSRLSERYDRIENKLDLIDQLVSQYYLNQDDIDVDQLEENIYYGYLAGLDEPYTTYYTAEEYQRVMESSSGEYSGIGTYVSQDVTTGIITFVNPFEEGPAYGAGIRNGDVLYAVEGEEVTGEDLNDVVARMKGEEGTDVNLTIYRSDGDQYIDVTVTRQNVEVPTVEYEMLEDHIGYIQITEFDDVTVEQFKEAVDDLRSQGMEKVIFDVRDNPGGLFSSVCDILDVLLPQELLVYTEDKDGNREETYAEDDDALDIPMAVLVNGSSASASEIFTGALKDYDKAEIIGTTTFGKGIVQSIIPLSDGSAVKITTSKYYTPSGVCIHDIGIDPDIEVEAEADTTDSEAADDQLQSAIDYLQGTEN